ncbi:MAG: NAD(P)H-dependent flavin oxidoreductase [Acidiferrobacterales bacterium]|nr:nitronate monooxygenase [Nitrospirota bacterium]
MLTTRFTELVGCSVPIQQAGMGRGLATPRLAAAVANAGGLGMVSVFGDGHTPAVVAQLLDSACKQTAGSIGANFLMVSVDPALAGECVAAAASRARVVDFFWGDPDSSLVEIVHVAGALACWQVGSREEGVAAAAAGCDFIIAQCIEAGGHVRGRIGLLALLDEVLAAVDVPVLVGGGIGSGRALAAVLAAGAEGVRVGTRFLASEETGTHPSYVKALIAAEAKDTVYTEAFSFDWPNAPHRVLRSSIEAAETYQEGEVVGEYVDVNTGKRRPIHRFETLDVHKGVTGAIEAMPYWAGESVDGVKVVQPAAEIVRELMDEAERLLRRWN